MWTEEMAGAAVLVGGESRRMGCNKAFLKLGQDNLVESIALKLKTLFHDVFLVGSDPAPYSSLGLPVVADIYKGCGPLAGIHAALQATTRPYLFVTACDMPFLDLKMVSFLVAGAWGYDAVVPKIGEYLEPLCAVYGKACLPAAEANLRRGQGKITDIFPKVRVKYVELKELRRFDVEKAFFNINTPKDMKKAWKLKKSGAHRRGSVIERG